MFQYTLNLALDNLSVQNNPSISGGVPLVFLMLCMLLFALWFQDSHATQVYFTIGNYSLNMPAETVCFLNGINLFYFLAKKCVYVEKL